MRRVIGLVQWAEVLERGIVSHVAQHVIHGLLCETNLNVVLAIFIIWGGIEDGVIFL